MTNNIYTDDERAAIMATARATLERLENDQQQYAPRGETRNQRDRRQISEQEERDARDRAIDRHLTAAVRAKLSEASIDWQARIDEAVKAERERLLKKVLPEVLGHFSGQIQRLRLDIDAMKREQQSKSNVTELTRKPA
jgi:hypothetical protein